MYQGHEASVVAVAFSPDDFYIVSGSPNGDIRVWDAKFGTKQCLKFILDGHDLGVTGCAFAPQNLNDVCSRNAKKVSFLLATCGNDNMIKLWDFNAEHGKSHVKLQQRNILSGHEGGVMGICFSPDGLLLASADIYQAVCFKCCDKTVRLWYPADGALAYKIEAHTRYVTSCAFSRDGLLLATGSNDKQVKIWQIIGEDELKEAALCAEEIGLTVALPSTAPSITIEQLTVSDVWDWMKQIGMSQYSEAFKNNAIDGTELAGLTHDSLEKSLGVAAFGHRNKILRAIAKFKDSPNFQPRSIDDEGIPDEFMCPITREVMRDPVIASDGYTYERLAISSWVKKGKFSSPMTNEAINRTEFVPNHSLKMLIQRHLEEKKT